MMSLIESNASSPGEVIVIDGGFTSLPRCSKAWPVSAGFRAAHREKGLLQDTSLARNFLWSFRIPKEKRFIDGGRAVHLRRNRPG